ncbi:MAG: hypothetical protein K2O04_05275 [Clostridiales bacterium]|nr:hypothetical protein [Clostridiales bacterium]
MGKINSWLNKLKDFKHLRIIACVAVLVIVLVVYFSCASCSESSSATFSSGNIDTTSADYCTSMRAQVEKIVSEISGVGSASVVINWDKSSVQSAFGNGQTENPKAVGALIVCDGGNSTKVKLDVIYAVSTLLDLSIEKIMVYPKSN